MWAFASRVGRALSGGLLSCLLVSSAARASSLELGWTAPAGCPDRAAALRSIGQLLKRRGAGPLGAPSAGAAPRVGVDVVLTPATPAAATTEQRAFEAHLTTRTASGVGERRFSGSSCERVADAATLIVAMTLDPVGVASRVGPVGPLDDEIQIGVGAEATLDVGALPLPALGAGPVVDLRYERWHVQATAMAFLPRVATRGPHPGSGGEIGLYTAGLRGCFDALDLGETTGLRAGACLEAQLGYTTGRGIDIRYPARSGGLWGAALVGFTLREIASPLSPWLSIDVGAPYPRPTYEIEGYGPVFRSSPIIARASLGMAWIFP